MYSAQQQDGITLHTLQPKWLPTGAKLAYICPEDHTNIIVEWDGDDGAISGYTQIEFAELYVQPKVKADNEALSALLVSQENFRQEKAAEALVKRGNVVNRINAAKTKLAKSKERFNRSNGRR